MKNFKMGFIMAIAVTTLLITSCKKDDCVAPDVAENIIGTWKVQFSSSVVEFKTDGTLEDPDDALIGGEINGEALDQKTYVATNDSLFLVAASANTSSSVDVALPIEGNECDKITLELLGINVALNRE